MATTLAKSEATEAQVSETGPRRWTIEEFERIREEVIPEGERVELIEGLIYTKMGQNEPHITALYAVFAALQEAFGPGYHLGMRVPLKLGTHSKPEPDVIVRRGTWRDYDGRSPDPASDIPLLVEVSDTTLADDRERKARLYAKHGVPEYWIVNLQDRTLEVRRGPRPESEDYFETLVYREGESAIVNGASVPVVDLLPKPTEAGQG